MNDIRFAIFAITTFGAALALLMSGCASNPTIPVTGSDLSMKVVLEPKLRLAIEIQNNSGLEIVASKDSLPWEWRYSLWVKAYETDAGGSPLDERLPISDPSRTESVRMAPGSKLDGRIDLESRFPDLQAALAKRDVVIFWSYQPEFEPVRMQRLAGWLTIPKRDL